MLRKLYASFEQRFLIGRGRLQPFFERLHRISLRGMNYGQNHSSETNGEVWVMNYVKKMYSGPEKDMVLFDVGANRGQYVSSLMPVFPASRIFCFEPSPSAYLDLQKVTSACGNIKCFPFAFGDQETTLNLYSEVDGSVLASFNPLTDKPEEQRKKIVVPVKTLDGFCEEQRITQIDLLKIDVEGFEYFVLKGGARMISENRIRRIQFEFGQNNIANGIYLKHFFDLLPGYRISRILKDGLRPLQYAKELEIILTTNYLAEILDQ